MTGPSPDYCVVGLSREAGTGEIKHAYRCLARACHPDLNPDDAEGESASSTSPRRHEQLFLHADVTADVYLEVARPIA